MRDGLTLLKFAHSDAEKALAGVERDDWLKLRANIIVLVAQLLRSLRGFNPDLTTWERARDPSILVQGRETRSGLKRNFDYPRIKGVYEEIRKKVWEGLTPISGARLTSSRAEPIEASAEPQGRANSEPKRPDQHPLNWDVPDATRSRERRVGAAGGFLGGWPGLGGPPGGQFRLNTTEEDSSSWTDVVARSGKRPDRRKSDKNKKYGHREDDLDFFRGAFEDEVSALHKLNLGDDFKYPSDEAFKRYFPEFDFVKAMRGSNLRKWDGTVRDYPGFKHNYYRMVYVQREHYMHKILALEQMVPEQIKKELFHGLQYTVEDLGQRLQRLEDRYGGQEKQTKQIVNDLQRLHTRGRVPYPELRAAVEDVSAYLDRPSTLPGTGETLVVLLKKIIPKHFRTQYNDAMHQWGQPRTGNNFVEYMKRKLTYEIDESDDHERKEAAVGKKLEENKEKKNGNKVLGKLYQTRATWAEGDESGSASDGSIEGEGVCQVTNGKIKELPQCKCCLNGRHYLHNCRQFFLEFALKDRVAFAKQQKICWKCLRYDHELKDCTFQAKPDCRFCAGRSHHYLLCPGPEMGSVQVADGEPGVQEGYGFENVGELIARKNVSTLQLVANVEATDGRLMPVNILPDTGSSHNIMDKKAAARAGVTGFRCKYRVTAHGGHVTEHEAICAEVTLCNPKHPEEKHQIKVYAYDNPCGPFFPVDWGKLKGNWPHLKGLDIPSPVKDQPIEMILGCENLRLFEAIKPPTIRGATEPVARLTSLGWMIGGRTYPEPSPDVEGESRVVEGDVGIASGDEGTNVSNAQKRPVNAKINPPSLSSICRLAIEHDSAECHTEYENLKKNLKRVWELETEEDVGRLINSHYPAVKTYRQKRAEAMMLDHLRQLDNGQYETKLMWSSDRRPRNNYVAAKKAYLEWERRLAGDEETRNSFHTSMANWIDNQYVENTVNDPHDTQNFLTTFVVFKEDEVPKKGRLVVNGARRFGKECLNDFLEVGSNVMNDLSELLMRIRRYRYVACCDLKNMFLNIRVAEEDRPFLRLFYREQPSQRLEVYQFAVHAFRPCLFPLCRHERGESTRQETR